MFRKCIPQLSAVLLIASFLLSDYSFATELSKQENEAIGLNNEGVKALNQGNFKAAIEFFIQSLNVKPDYELALSNLNIALGQGGFKGKEELPFALCRKWLNEATDLMNEGRFDTALPRLKAIVGLDPNPRVRGKLDVAEYLHQRFCSVPEKAYLMRLFNQFEAAWNPEMTRMYCIPTTFNVAPDGTIEIVKILNTDEHAAAAISAIFKGVVPEKLPSQTKGISKVQFTFYGDFKNAAN